MHLIHLATRYVTAYATMAFVLGVLIACVCFRCYRLAHWFMWHFNPRRFDDGP